MKHKSPHLLLKPCLGVLVLCAASQQLDAKNIVVTTIDNVSPAAGQTSLKQAISQLADGDTIQFNIPGNGPLVIVTPLGGYPLITANNVTIDGYSQPGSKPNSNGILGGNNAQIQIVLDSSGEDSQPSPDANNPDLLIRHSTRLTDFSGYGDSENAILGVLGGDGFKVRGLSFLGRPTEGSTQDPAIYAIALVQEAKNAKVQGCWFGLKPGDPFVQESIKPVTAAVAAFRYRTGGDVYSGGLTAGTDGDGTNDVQEFNVMVGCHIALAIEAPDLRVSGNYVNVFPDGITFVDVEAISAALQAAGRSAGDSSVEFMENGRLTDNTIVGTNGDNKSDGNERNIVAHALYSHDIEFYSNANNAVVAGNYFGVGVNGTTTQQALTSRSPDFISLPGGNASIRVGSNGDGVNDAIEGNVISGVQGARFVQSGVTVPITARRNKMVNNAFEGFPFPDGADSRPYATYYANAIADPAAPLPVITSIVDGIMTGTVPAPLTANYPKHVVDIYVVDPKAAANGLNLPGTYAGSFVEGGAGDQDAAANKFKVDLRGLPIVPGDSVALAVTYTSAATGTPGTNSLTGPLSAPSVANLPVIVPGSVESIGLTRIVPDKPLIVPQTDALGNWEPYVGVLGNSIFLIEGNTFAEGFDAPDGKQRYVVALQPVDGKPGKLVEGFYNDSKQPFKAPINASRQNGNPGRVAGDARPGATHYIVGGEASPHTLSPDFTSDNRWNLGFDRLADGRYGVVQIFNLDTATLTPTPLMKAVDSSNGRLTSGTPPSNQISRYGADLAGLDNGNFVSVVEDRSHVIASADAALATIFAPDGTIVKDTFIVALGDIWSNVTAYQGGFAVRCKPQDGSNTRVIYLFDNAGTLKNTITQSSSGASFDTGRGDGTRIAGHINSPYIFLAGKVTDAQVVKLAVWDTRDPQRFATFDVSEPAFVGNNDRATVAIDALNRATVAWVSNPDGYEAAQVAARVLALNGDTMTITALTPSFFPFINAAKTGGIRTLQMEVAMTTKQICVAAKGEINLQNKPLLGAEINPATGAPLRELNFYTVFSHPNPQDDPTKPATAVGSIVASAARSGGDLVVTWTGGNGPFKVQRRTTLADAWTDATTTDLRTYTTPATGASSFFRIVGN